ncbi:hypothetical protein, partial [Campylobacter upsaliensis]|uniref:hypothetical protein n=1 Tax=Campylobacter upsaliensis TaxID=28080 RepID=UPI0022EB0427
THTSSYKKPLLSLVCILALSCVVEASSVTNSASSLNLGTNSSQFKVIQRTQKDGKTYDQNQGVENYPTDLAWTVNDHGSTIDYVYIALAYQNNPKLSKVYVQFDQPSTIQTLQIDTKKYDNAQKDIWTYINRGNGNNVTINNLKIMGDTKTVIEPQANKNYSITTIEHSGLNLDLKTKNNSTLTITTFNQNSGTTEISSNSIKIENFKLNAGSVNNNGGTITTL